MRNIRCLLIVFISLFILNSCSGDDDSPSCPTTENISMKINGELKQFTISGWGIDLDNDGSGHTLSLWIYNGVFNPQQDTYQIILKLPYKKTGSNVIEEFYYSRTQNGSSSEVDFVTGEFQSKVTINKNTCVSATFSGNVVLDGNEIVITEGVFNHVYSEPFD